MPSDYTDDLRLAHVLADDADSTSQARFKALDLHVMTKPDLTPGHRRGPVRRGGHPPDPVPGPARATPCTARRAAPPGTASAAGWSTRSTAPRTSSAGVPVWATLISLMVDDEVVVGVVSAPMLNRRWWAMQGRRRLDRQVAAARHRLPGLRRLPDRGRVAVLLARSHGWDERGRLDDFLSLSRRCWRTRAYGDFWSYMLVAEGAVDIAAEPDLHSTTWPRST